MDLRFDLFRWWYSAEYRVSMMHCLVMLSRLWECSLRARYEFIFAPLDACVRVANNIPAAYARSLR